MAAQLLEDTAFDRFLAVAREKPFSQKLLLVFAEKELRSADDMVGDVDEIDDDFSVKPLMYIDKTLDEVSSFEGLLEDSLKSGRAWDLLYVTVADVEKIDQAQIDQRLEVMVKVIHQGEAERFLIFNALGEVAELNKVGS